MPLPLILLVGGFGAGFLTGANTSKLLKLGLLGGGGYIAYQAYKGA